MAVSFTDQNIISQDILTVSNTATSLCLSNCTSADWLAVCEALKHLTNLHTLTLKGCDLDRQAWKALGQLGTIRTLSVDGCGFDRTVKNVSLPRQLEHLTLLNQNYMHNMKDCSDEIYNYIFRELPKLVSLNAPAPNLKSFRLWSAQITDAGMDLLVNNMRGRHELAVVRNNLTDASAGSIVKLKGLVELDISYTDIGDDGAQLVAKLPCISVLEIQSTKIGRKGLLVLANSLPLEFLNISRNKYSDEDSYNLSRGLARLNKLTAHGCQFGSESLGIIASNCPLMRTLRIDSNRNICCGYHLLGRLPQLFELNICTQSQQERANDAVALGCDSAIQTVEAAEEVQRHRGLTMEDIAVIKQSLPKEAVVLR